jgi:NADH dehydrogenase (ubiquinone) Fe-S protein 1
MINLTINNVEVSVLPNTSVLKACEIAGFEIPRFCYHKRLSVAGNCRMCLVEVEKSPKPVVSCAMPVMRGMNIFTDTPLVKKARENVLEFLLENHPLDCPICDQGGECDLQDQAMAFGSDKSRFYDSKRGVLDKNIGPLIKTIMTRCIHCTRCVRFGEEIAGVEDLGTTIRGTKTEIGTYLEKIFKTELSGNIIDLCPVGALTSKPYAFTVRPWELKTNFIVDVSDALGTKVKVDIKDDKIVRVSPFYLNKENTLAEIVESSHLFRDFWISDKTRFSYEGLSHEFSVYIDLIGNSEKKELFQKLFSNISLTNFAVICGYNIDLETLQTIKYFVQSLNEKTQSTVCSLNTSRNFYLTNPINEDVTSFQTTVSIDNLEDIDLCLLLGVNPRFEASSYNVHLRKRVKQGGFKIASIGASLNLTYPVSHLGTNIQILDEIASENHPFMDELIAAKNPMILVSSNLLETEDFLKVELCLDKIKRNRKMVLSDASSEIKYGVLQSYANQLGALALNIQGLKKDNFFENTTFLYLLGVDPKETKDILENSYLLEGNNKMSYVVSQNFRFNSELFVNNMLGFALPVRPYIEKVKSSFLSTEGNLQVSKGVISGPKKLLINTELTLKILLTLLSFYYVNIFKKDLGQFSYSSFEVRRKLNIERLLFSSSLNQFSVSKKKLWFSKIEDFYLTDSVSYSSAIMGKCSIIAKSNSTSFDF